MARNNHFKFKQFTIYQQHCAMKVCTDSCLFGAIVAKEINNTATHLLDIGVGTGLLSLMIAQAQPLLKIHAVEIEEKAFTQAAENIAAASILGNNIQLYHNSIQQYTSANKYEVIISNPPFYSNSLKTEDSSKNTALHCQHLSYQELITAVKKHLCSHGLFYVLLPHSCSTAFIQQAQQQQLFVHQLWQIKQSTTHTYFRTIICFTNHKPNNIIEQSFAITNADGSYTQEFTSYLKAYYLYL